MNYPERNEIFEEIFANYFRVEDITKQWEQNLVEAQEEFSPLVTKIEEKLDWEKILFLDYSIGRTLKEKESNLPYDWLFILKESEWKYVIRIDRVVERKGNNIIIHHDLYSLNVYDIMKPWIQHDSFVYYTQSWGHWSGTYREERWVELFEENSLVSLLDTIPVINKSKEFHWRYYRGWSSLSVNDVRDPGR